ncbi:helix-turn-helix domain-containing protein [Enterococcus sp. AN402]|uniref:helix-turn-helix domain-containing protein n=1 Tax=Enterococcus sp. AN402 TaxID=3151386 RepID=UPI003457F23A
MITYTMIKAATKDDMSATQEILCYFDSYIDCLCMHPFVYDNGRVEYCVDTLMKTQLQGKLLQAIIKFKL